MARSTARPRFKSKFVSLANKISRDYGMRNGAPTPVYPVTLGKRFEDALVYAATIHRNQARKSTTIPYVSHLLIVAGTVLEYGGNEDEVIAALLHDAAEDEGGAAELAQIRVRFGDGVAKIVTACSDAMPENKEKKPPWKERKAAYHKHLRECGETSVFLVSAADKLHNARATAADLRQEGDSVWRRFNATKSQALWNYRTLIKIYSSCEDERVRRLATELERTVAELE